MIFNRIFINLYQTHVIFMNLTLSNLSFKFACANNYFQPYIMLYLHIETSQSQHVIKWQML